MWHVDEGALHAYLDGALDEYPAAEASRVREHLDACAQCSERLDEERRVRSEAQEILGLAAPRVEVPSFEELRAYVRAQPPRRTAASARVYRLGWAASVVLALGTGWLLRGDVAPALMRADQTGLGASGAAAARAAESARELSAEGQRAASDLVADGATGSEPADQPAAARAEQEPEARDAAGTRREADRLDVVAGNASGDGASGAAFADVAAVDEVATKTTDDASAALGADARRVAVASPERTAVPTEPTPPPAVGATAVGARQDTVRPEARAAPRVSVEQRLTSAITATGPLTPTQVAPATVAPEVAGGAAARGRAADADDAARTSPDAADEEAVSLVVPGLEVLAVLPVGEGTSFRGMRALQRLQAGDTLELVHLPEGIEPSSLPPLRAGWNELVRPRGAGWLVMRAPVTEATLAELLQRLESGR